MNPAFFPSKRQPRRALQRAFTLIEIMIVVAIVAVLTAIAVPSYRDYVIRGRLTNATNALSALRANMERHFQDNKTYLTFTTGGATPVTYNSPCSAAELTTLNASLATQNFTMTCPAGNLTATTFTLSIAGTGPVNGFVFTLDQAGTMTSTGTTGAATGWGTSTDRWCIKRGC